ncbi:MAG TPA: hypothetical protein VES20_14135 [Bryobacteraceae bacterium]|nr:hypothetical protein [Bryobacteraceae bacterium]
MNLAAGLLATVMLALLPTSSVAQLLPPMQASQPEEFDMYVAILEAPSEAARAELARRFEQTWPQSELLAHTLYLEAEAHRTLGDSNASRAAAEKALALVRDHLPGLVLLSELTGNAAANEKELLQAENYAQTGLELLERFRAPRSIPLQELERARNGTRSRLHAALGLIAFKRGQLTSAIREFEAAEACMPREDPVILYRLAKLYRESNQIQRSIATFQRVIKLSEPTLQRLARSELQQLQQNR